MLVLARLPISVAKNIFCNIGGEDRREGVAM
jgi:hypothetical protein